MYKRRGRRTQWKRQKKRDRLQDHADDDDEFEDRNELRVALDASVPLSRYVKRRFGLNHVEPFLDITKRARWVFDERTVRDLGQGFLQPLIPSAYADIQKDFGEADTRQALHAYQLLRSINRPIALYVHVKDVKDDASREQMLQSAQFLVELNQTGAIHIVFVNDEDAGILRDKLSIFRTDQYPKNIRKRSHLFTHLHVMRSSERFERSGARAVWLDWVDDARGLGNVPRQARDVQVHGNRLADGSILDFNEGNNGFGASLLQAVLLLNDPDQSELQKSAAGPYVQISRGAFAKFGQIFAALQRIASSA